MFRIEEPSEQDLAFFHENGYAAFPGVLTEEGRQGLAEEILRCAQVVEFLGKTEEERGRLNKPHRISVGPWNDKGPRADRLFDAPLVTALLRAVVGEAFHFCHSTLRVSMRGAGGLGFHQDNQPVNLAERHKWYIQMLYYPNGFERGDASLWVIPGSHRISDWGEHAPHGPKGEVTTELLTRLYGDQVGRTLRAEELSLPPGSMVFLNARTFHAVSPKPADSAQEMRLFSNYIFKAPGSPHRNTQAIPPEWMERASQERRRLFQRESYTPVIV
jgi:hypothetical protein